MTDSLQVPEILCLEFCNSGASVRLNRGSDALPDFASLLEWLKDEGFSLDLAAPGGEFGKVIAFREILFRSFSATGNEKDKLIVSGEVQRAVARLRLVEKKGDFTLVPDLAGLSISEAALTLVALSTAKLLTGEAKNRLRVCANDECQWLFLDRSKNKSRRWCEMSSCGNKMKARRHYARKREELTQ